MPSLFQRIKAKFKKKKKKTTTTTTPKTTAPTTTTPKTTTPTTTTPTTTTPTTTTPKTTTPTTTTPTTTTTAPGGGKTGGTAKGGSTGTASTLKPEVRSRYKKVKSGFVPRIVKKMKDDPGNFTLTEEQRKDPDKVAPPKDTPEKAREGIDGWTNTIGGDVAAPGLDAGSGFVDYVGGGKSRSWDDVHKSSSEDKWGDGEKQSEGVPVAGAVVKSIKLIINAASYIKKMVEFTKNNKNSSDTDSDEKQDTAFRSAEIVLQLLDTVSSWIGAFTTFLGKLPIVGAILGAVSAGVSFALNCIQFNQARHVKKHMKTQREQAKIRIKDKQGKLGSEYVKIQGNNRLEMNKDYGKKLDDTPKPNATPTPTSTTTTNPTTTTNTKTKTKPGKMRARRLDEKTSELREEHAGDQEKLEAVEALEDYDLTDELTQAAAKRKREGLVSLILRDAAGFAASLANLDPTGLGSGIGAAINGVIGLGFLGRKIGISARQKARKTGALSSDINRSTKNKERRRHNLSVIMFDRLKALEYYGYENIEPDTTVSEQEQAIQEGVDSYETMEQRVTALGLAGPIFRAKDAKEMVYTMRRGFYRDNT